MPATPYAMPPYDAAAFAIATLIRHYLPLPYDGYKLLRRCRFADYARR